MKETEQFRAALARLKDAENKAYKDAPRCALCRRANTLNVQQAELNLVHLVRSPDFERLLDLVEA